MATPKRFYEHINPDINQGFFDLNPDKPAIWKIYNLYFRILVEQRFSYEEEEVAHFGVLTSGDSDVDDEDAKRPVLKQHTIWELAKYLNRGIDFSLCDWEQSVIIYGLIDEALKQILSAASEQIHYDTKDYPMEDIRILDEFAAEMWKKAKGYYKHNPKHEGSILSGIPQRITTQRRTLSPARNVLGIGQEFSKQAPIPETHKPIAPLIAGKLKLRS